MLELFLFEKDDVDFSSQLRKSFTFTNRHAFLIKKIVSGQNANSKPIVKYGFINHCDAKLDFSVLPYNQKTTLSSAIIKKFHVKMGNCVIIARSKAILDLAKESGVPIILFNIDPNLRIEYQKKYKPIYVCDNENDLTALIKLYGKSTLEEIKQINSDIARPIIETKALKPSEQGIIGNYLYPVYNIIMTGRSLENFNSQFSDKRCAFVEVMMYVNKLNKPLGFIIMFGHELKYPKTTGGMDNKSNDYTVCEILIGLLPEIQNNRYLGSSILPMLDEYHIKHPNRNIVVFESMMNYKSYKAALRGRTDVERSAFPQPLKKHNAMVEELIQHLKIKFGYRPIGSDPYTVETISDPKVKETPVDQSDIYWKFYIQKTGNKKNIGLLTLSSIYLVENNSLELHPQSQFFYDRNYKKNRDPNFCSKESIFLALKSNQQNRDLGRLLLLSLIFRTEINLLSPIYWDLPKTDMHRTTVLWYRYFSQGIFLSGGGVNESFIKMNRFIHNRNIAEFNRYRSDRSESTNITQEDIKKFLLEENALTKNAKLDELSFSFSLGSHEGAIRVARCVYASKKNDGIFYLLGSYGFLAASGAVMRPMPYRVRMLDIDRNNGEKLSLSDFEKQLKKYPTTRTLFLELKTICGATYSKVELEEIIKLCKQYGVFLIVDAAHINMHYCDEGVFQDVVSIAQNCDFHDFAVIYTGSKTYGLERARVGFVVLSTKSKIPNFWARMEIDFYRVNGSTGDIPFEVARVLFDTPVLKRKEFLKTTAEKLRFNMNLMLAYIEGVDSKKIDEDIKEKIIDKISPKYRIGIKGFSIVYKPTGGLQLKVEMSQLCNNYFANIRMSNSEIFGYALNKMTNVVILNSSQIMDPRGFGMRLTYSVEDDVHQGMMAIHDFVESLLNHPEFNRFLPEFITLEMMLKDHQENIQQDKLKYSKSHTPQLSKSDFIIFKENIKSRMPSYIKVSDAELEEAITNAAKTIQRKWKMYYRQKKGKNNDQKIRMSKL